MDKEFLLAVITAFIAIFGYIVKKIIDYFERLDGKVSQLLTAGKLHDLSAKVLSEKVDEIKIAVDEHTEKINHIEARLGI